MNVLIIRTIPVNKMSTVSREDGKCRVRQIGVISRIGVRLLMEVRRHNYVCSFSPGSEKNYGSESDTNYSNRRYDDHKITSRGFI